jgi:DNA-binding GntR family transcriptional regulator
MTDEAQRKRRGRPPKPRAAAGRPDLRVVRSGLHEQAAARIRDMIANGDLAPGTPIVEVELSEALGISRTPLREALKLLAQQGLIELRANRSPCVRPLRIEEIHDLFEALAGIERLAIEFAMSRIDDREVERLRALQAEIVAHHAAGDRAAYSAANRTIHRTIVAAARNASLAAIHDMLLGRAELVRFTALRIEDRWEQSIAEHAAILAAIEARDPARAGALLEAHVGQTAAIVEAAITAPAR